MKNSTQYRVKTPDGRVECFTTKKEVEDFIQKDSKGSKELAKQYIFAHYHLEAVAAKKHWTVYWKRDSGPTDIEEPLGDALIEHGYKEGEVFIYQYPVGGYFLDFAFIKEKIDIETDGERWHPEGNPRDKVRDANLKKMGWKVLRFPGNRIKRDLDGVIKEVAEVVSERSKRSSGGNISTCLSKPLMLRSRQAS